MNDFSVIIDHPDKEDIISKLLTGTTPKDVSQWLKLKYPKKEQSHLRLTIKILKEFIKSGYTDCYEQFKKDLVVVKNTNGKIDKKQLTGSLLNNKTYRERLINIAEQEIDIKTMLKSLITVCQERAEQIFDQIQQDPLKFKGDHYFLRYMTEISNLIEKFEKIVNHAPDQIIQHNVTLQAVETNTNAILTAIRTTLEKLDTETSLLFMENFYNELGALKPPSHNEMSQEERMKEARLLQEKVIKVDIP